MERKYICIDCSKEFIINSSRNTHAKRCSSCRKSYRKIYDRVWKSNKRLSSPSLDKVIPSLGYVKGNIWVISYRANTIKNNCTFEEIEKLYKSLHKMRRITGRIK